MTEDEEKLLEASRQGNLKEVSKLVRNNQVDINCLGQFDFTPLHFAASEGHYDVAKFLLKNQADPDAQDVNGSTPMHQAYLWRHFELVDLLEQYGADPNMKNDFGRKPKTKLKDIIGQQKADTNEQFDVKIEPKSTQLPPSLFSFIFEKFDEVCCAFTPTQ